MKTFITILTPLKIALIGIILFCFVARADEVLTRDERIVALTLLGEARGEGRLGMFAVGCVIQARASVWNPKFERRLSPAEICLQPWQFSIWNAGKGKVKKERDLVHLWFDKDGSPSIHRMYVRELARFVCNDGITLVDVTNGANHYHNKKPEPYWAKGRKPTKIIGKHKFYKLP